MTATNSMNACLTGLLQTDAQLAAVLNGMDLSRQEEAALARQIFNTSANPSPDVCKAYVDGLCSQASPTQALEKLQLLQRHQLEWVGQQPIVQLLQRLPPGQTCSNDPYL